MGRSTFSGPVKSTGGFEIGAVGTNTEVIDSSGNVKGKRAVEVISASTTLDATGSGKLFTIGTDALVITLPPTASGLQYTFVNSGADGAAIITISPDAADAIHGTITLAATVVELGGVDNKDLINTKASATTGNSVTIVGDGSVGWYVVSSTGIWASEV